MKDFIANIHDNRIFVVNILYDDYLSKPIHYFSVYTMYVLPEIFI